MMRASSSSSRLAAVLALQGLVVLGPAAAWSGCSLLGTPASPPGPAPHAGTGQFRTMTSDETGVGAVPQGATIVLSNTGIDDGMTAEGHFFYAAGRAIPVDAGMRDAGVDAGDDLPDSGDPLDAGVDAAMPPDASAPDASAMDAGLPPAREGVDWSLYEPRAIFHSPPEEEWGFTTGNVVLEAAEAWEGSYVTDPWVVERDDGSFLLFYAAAGGIGVARSASIEGPWTRESGPLLGAVDGEVPRRPSAVRTAALTSVPETTPDAELLVYYELAGRLHVATWDEGSFTELRALELPPLPQRDDRDGDEIDVGAPGAIVVPTPGGRSIVRVYYESRRSNGTTLVGLMASADGVTFDVFERPVYAERNRQRPAPRIVDERTTILYAWVPSRQAGAVIGTVSPAAVDLAAIPPTP